MRALFAPAAGPQIGGGHVLRDLALAAALQARGWRCTFAVPPWGARLVQRFAAAPAPDVRPIERGGDVEALGAAVDALRPDLLALDDYALTADAVRRLARAGLVRLVIDDRADRLVDCEMLVDPGYGRRLEHYADFAPAGCAVLAGPAYALLRPAFAGAGAGRPIRGPVRRVFVSFGLSDVDGVTARAVERLRPRAPDAHFDVALASDAASLPGLSALAAKDPALRLHPDATDVARLMRGADVAVGAGGASTWERCALGLPSLAVMVADNQRPSVEGLAAAGALLAVDLRAPGFDGALTGAFDRLLQPKVRARLAAASRAVCDGRGAERVAEAVERRLSGAGTPGS